MDYYEQCRGSFFRPGGFDLTKHAIEYCAFKENSLIADIGCGTGESARLAEKEFGLKILKFEPSPAMAGEGSGVIQAFAEQLPVVNKLLDGILCECSLSLCNDINPALSEFYRALKPSGFLIISDIYSKSVPVKTSGALKHIYTKEMLQAFLSGKGFEMLLFEDHSRELAKMRARLIMEGQDLLNESIGGLSPRELGYFLIISRKY